MGGSITIGIRRLDGSEYISSHGTNSLPYWLASSPLGLVTIHFKPEGWRFFEFECPHSDDKKAWGFVPAFLAESGWKAFFKARGR